VCFLFACVSPHSLPAARKPQIKRDVRVRAVTATNKDERLLSRRQHWRTSNPPAGLQRLH